MGESVAIARFTRSLLPASQPFRRINISSLSISNCLSFRSEAKDADEKDQFSGGVGSQLSEPKLVPGPH